jgi:hypothetical protein
LFWTREHVWESLDYLDAYLFFYAFILLKWLAFVIFGTINFLAIPSMHVCLVAWYR